ncbi:hypothetical protein [Kineococcus aurantiacus]|uniref:Uncharacterized protein n=1 Tax=Kineococcus aurantiacus TaxID=37633 RepID=A0A7Y9J2J5_9ACTN|nr:hypothetical protein [Kineococcus aurantiacus]NYD24215.1 hypothetical protein [Kineococcus aurantiacus]
MRARQLLPEEVGITVLGRLLLVGAVGGGLVGGATGAVLGSGLPLDRWDAVPVYAGVLVGLVAGVLTQAVTALVVHLVHRRVQWDTVLRTALLPPVLGSGSLVLAVGSALPPDLALAAVVAAVALTAATALRTVRWCLAPYLLPDW